MGALARVYLARRGARPSGRCGWSVPAIFWTALAAGVLLKGPLILMFVGLTALTLSIADRSARWLLRAAAAAGHCSGCCFWCCHGSSPSSPQSGDSFFAESVGHDLLGKVASGAGSARRAARLSISLLFWITFWPGAMLAAWPRRRSGRRGASPARGSCWPGSCRPGSCSKLVMTKLPHYVLPLYPAIAILIARAIAQEELSVRPWLVRGAVWWFVVPLLLTGLGIGASIAISREPGLLAWPLVAATVVVGFFAWRSYRSEGAPRALLRVGVASVLLYATLYGVVIPSMTKAFPAPILAKVLQDAGCSDPQAASVGYQEPSLVFLAGTKTLLTDANSAADFVAPGGCRFALVDSRFESDFLQHAGAIGLQYTLGPRFDAINISGGRKITIAVYRAGKTP